MVHDHKLIKWSRGAPGHGVGHATLHIVHQ